MEAIRDALSKGQEAVRKFHGQKMFPPLSEIEWLETSGAILTKLEGYLNAKS